MSRDENPWREGGRNENMINPTQAIDDQDTRNYIQAFEVILPVAYCEIVYCILLYMYPSYL